MVGTTSLAVPVGLVTVAPGDTLATSSTISAESAAGAVVPGGKPNGFDTVAPWKVEGRAAGAALTVALDAGDELAAGVAEPDAGAEA